MRPSQRDSNARGAGRHHGPAPFRVFRGSQYTPGRRIPLVNARAAVVRCSGARVLRTPSHVKASFTAAIVVRSLWAAERSSWVVGWVVDRGDWFWLVSWDVVVAVDIGTCDLLGGWVEGPAAKTADRLVAAQAWKSPWLVTVLERWQARSATGATMEPPVTMGRNQGAKIPDERRASIRLRDGAARGTP